MAEMWTLGGLPAGELLRRTIRECWEDSIFGQGGRMAFYQFLAIFPCLLVFLDLTARFFQAGDHASSAIGSLSGKVFPAPVSRLFLSSLERLRSEPLSGLQLTAAFAGAIWSGLNAMWAMVYGLNRAYEVEERRSWWSLGLTIGGIGFCLTVAGAVAVFLVFGLLRHGATAAWITEWLVLILVLLFSFEILYRFAPCLPDPEWQWSTPGAVSALALWIAATFGFRYYFEHVTDYSTAYGPLNGVAMYLLWLYVTNGAILIGGEMNSEIEKARGARRGGTPGESKG